MTEQLSESDQIVVSAMLLAGFRTSIANQRQVQNNFLIKTWNGAGLGDQICAEPTMRYALNQFKDCRISLASDTPEIFHHLKFHEVFDTKKVTPVDSNYLVFQTVYPGGHITNQFINQMTTNCVDYPSLVAFRCQLPVRDREVRLLGKEPIDFTALNHFKDYPEHYVVVHPGQHWQSKTFPKDWWDAVIAELFVNGKTPIIIGNQMVGGRGTVDVNASDCLDLRGKLSVLESIWLLQKAMVLLTNDSAPLHMAASGRAHIGYVATCKHPDLITHWRNGQWGWRMKNFGKGGLWEIINMSPGQANELSAEEVGEENLRSWLPDPREIVGWAVEKTKQE
jgi:hypothetical protein